MDDYIKRYNEYWRDIVEDENGNLDKDKVMRELADFETVISHVTKVYSHFSGGMVSKPMTLPSVVIDIAQDNENERYQPIFDFLNEVAELNVSGNSIVVCDLAQKAQKLIEDF